MSRAQASASWTVSVLALLAVGCASSGLPTVVRSRDISQAGGSPTIERVVDVGDLEEIPLRGPLAQFHSDGHVAIGELLLVEGDNFGKQPTVLIGGRSVRVLARTHGGGILVRVPAEVDSGRIEVEVSHPRGRHGFAIEVSRFALVTQPDPGALHFVAIQDGKSHMQHSMSMSGLRSACFSHDGTHAYAIATDKTGQSRVSVVLVPATGGPAVIQKTVAFKQDVVAVTAGVNVLVSIGTKSLQLFSLRNPWRPAAHNLYTLPKEIAAAAVVGGKLSPDGKWLALLLASGNRLALFDLSNPSAPRLSGDIAVLPGERVPLVTDLHFSLDGRSVWAVSGDNPKSRESGRWPTRLTQVALDAEGKASLVGTTKVPEAGPPLSLFVAKSRKVPSAAAIRKTEGAAVFVAAVAPQVLAEDAGDIALPGMLLRTNSLGEGGTFASLPFVVNALAVSPNAKTWVGTACGAGQFVLAIGALVGQSKPQTVEFGKLSSCKPPFDFADLELQP